MAAVRSWADIDEEEQIAAESIGQCGNNFPPSSDTCTAGHNQLTGW
jgi:hypothetical protein